jgi:hypothetical protein
MYSGHYIMHVHTYKAMCVWNFKMSVFTLADGLYILPCIGCGIWNEISAKLKKIREHNQPEIFVTASN